MSGPSPSGTPRLTLCSNSRLSGSSRASSRHQYVTPQENNDPVLEVEARRIPSRAPRSARDSAPPSIQARFVPSRDRRVGKSTLINVLCAYHAPKSGGGIRLQREDVPVKFSL